MPVNYRQRLEAAIPGGAHTYSRGWDQFPSNAPAILQKGRGAYVWTPSGDKLLDYGMGLRSIIFGYGDKKVSRAATQGLKLGQNLTLPSMLELDAAELFVDTIPAAEMVKFTKNGSSAVTAAVKLARGFTRRDKILVCRQHPFFSYDDWFISSTPLTLGIPASSGQQVVGFDYGNTEQVKQALVEHSGQIAAILLEPATDVGPTSGVNTFAPSTTNFLTELQALAKQHGSLLILDEMITGFRYAVRGAQSLFNVVPDLATFGKALGNGLPIAAVCGRREVMELGSINRPGAERLFLLSTTHGPEMASLAGAINVMKRLQSDSTLADLGSFGEEFMKQANQVLESHALINNLRFYGHPASPYYKVSDEQGNTDLQLRTVFSQEMIRNGVLIPYIGLSASHGSRELRKTIQALDKASETVKKAVAEGSQKYLEGPAVKPVFRKYN